MKTGKIQPQAAEERRNGQESSELYIPAFIAALIFLVFSALVLHAGIWGWLKGLDVLAKKDVTQSSSYRGASVAPAQNNTPRLQIRPQLDLAAYRREQDQVLNRYAWIDRTAGVVRIPINAAIDKLLKDGEPHWGPTNRSISPLELQRARAEGGRK